MKPPAKNGNVLNTRQVLWAVLAAIILPSAAAQTATLSPASLTFLSQVVGTTSAAKTATLTNTSSVSLTITSIQTTGDFAQTNNCGSSLAGGAKCTINATFTPTAMGSRTGTLSVNDNATPSPQTVSLSGSGTIVSLSPSTLSFGNVSVGIVSAPQSITLTNVGASSLKVTGVSITGTNAGDFSQTNTCGSSVAAKASCTITVTFKPTATGSRRATLNVSDNGGASPQMIGLSGTGTTATLVSIAVTPNSPSVALGSMQQFTATGTYSDGSTQNLTTSAIWASSNPAVATISNTSGSQGLATSLTQGTSTVTATSGSIGGSTVLTVTPATLISIALTPANPTIALGTMQQFTATGTFSDGSTQNLTTTATWASSNPAVASISNTSGSQGLATSLATGTTTITATSGSISGTTVLTVSPAAVVSIAVTPAIPSLALGTSQQFTATGTFTDGSVQNITQSVQWSSSATSVATISNASGSQGLASTVAVGTSTITATSGSVSGSTTLTVTAAALVSVAVSPANPTIGAESTQPFTATGTYTDGSTQNLTTTATWTSSTPSVATISNVSGSQGLATAVAAGTTSITATLGTIAGSTTLTVSSATLVSIAVSPANASIALGTSQQFTATGTFSDGSDAGCDGVAYWTSSALNVATISDSSPTIGLATSIGTGAATITAASGSITGSATLTVTAAALVSIAITPANSSIALGTTQQFTATGTFTDGSTQNLTDTVTWSSSSTTVAVISNSTGTQGLATSAAVGTTTITATSGSIIGSTLLTVVAAQLVSLAVTPVNPAIVQGGTQQFTATGTFTDGSTQNLTNSVSWGSSNPVVASINTNGLATGLAGGTSSISAVSGTITNSTTLTVTASGPVLTSITVTPVNPSIAIGITQQFTATGNYSDGSTQNLTNSVTWTSANTSVATVQSTGTSHPGLATGIATGTTNIQATYTTISGSTQIIVGQLFVATPLMDLGTGTYLSFEGGLYENGTDQIPADHLSDGLGFVTDVQPRDTNGNPSPTGKFVFLSIGMSNANDEFQAFLLQAKKDSSVNTATQVIANGAAGSMQACAWVQPYGSPPCASVPLPNQYDRIRDHILAAVGLTEAQVEVVWIEDCDRDPGPTNYPPLCDPTVEGCTNTTQTEAIRYEQETGQILRAAKTRWPNLTLAFISSRIYGGYSATTVSPEPYAYEYGFSGKWAIQAQITQIRTGTVDVIAGDLSYGVAPWVAWSAYTWAAGPIPRSDGLIWCDGQTNAPCNGEIDFENDGMHADTTGQMKVGTMLMNFFTTSQVTTPWFLKP